MPVAGNEEAKKTNEIGMFIPLLRIGCRTALNAYPDFPHVGQAFMIEREVFHNKTGKQILEYVVGITSSPPEQVNPERVLTTNRGH